MKDAKITTRGAKIFSVSGTMRWDSEIELDIAGREYKGKCSKIIEVAKEHCKEKATIELIGMLERDLKSEMGLKVGFPWGFLIPLMEYEMGTEKLAELLYNTESYIV